MLIQILQFLIETLAGFMVFLLLSRFYMQLARVSFRNPIGQFVTGLSNWMVMPARRVIPGIYGLDAASLVCAWVVQTTLVTLLLYLRGFHMDAGSDLLVMGGYGHTRWSEAVLGGVTSSILDTMDIPVLLAH